MKVMAAVLLGFSIVLCAQLAGVAQDAKEPKPEQKKNDKKDIKPVAAPKLEGKYSLVSGSVFSKKGVTPVGDDVKKWQYTFTTDRISIKNPDNAAVSLVFSYKLDASTIPMSIDMEVVDGPDFTKGSKAAGIFEVKGDDLKLAYTMEKDKRPKNFEGKDANTFVLKKKAEK